MSHCDDQNQFKDAGDGNRTKPEKVGEKTVIVTYPQEMKSEVGQVADDSIYLLPDPVVIIVNKSDQNPKKVTESKPTQSVLQSILKSSHEGCDKQSLIQSSTSVNLVFGSQPVPCMDFEELTRELRQAKMLPSQLHARRLQIRRILVKRKEQNKVVRFINRSD